MSDTKTLTLAQAQDTRWEHWPPAFRDALRKWWPLNAPVETVYGEPQDLPPMTRAVGEVIKASIATKPRRKGLGPKQLKWLRSNVQSFRDMEARAKASKLVASKVGK